MTKLSAADLYVIYDTLSSTLNVLNIHTTKKARVCVLEKLAKLMHSMEVSLVIENEEVEK